MKKLSETQSVTTAEREHAEMIRQGDIAHDPAMSQATRDMAARLAARIAAKNLEWLYGNEA